MEGFFNFISMEKILRYTLGKEERLKSRKEIEQLFKEGKSFSIFPFRIIYQFTTPSSAGSRLQAGFTVSTKHFKKATERNRIRRLIKEAYRLQKNELKQAQFASVDKLAIFFIYVAKELLPYLIVSEKMTAALHRLIQLSRKPKKQLF